MACTMVNLTVMKQSTLNLPFSQPTWNRFPFLTALPFIQVRRSLPSSFFCLLSFSFYLLSCSFCLLSFPSSAQQYGWIDLFPNMPDTPGDTIYIGGDPYYGSFTDLFFLNDQDGWVTSLQQDNEGKFLIFHTLDGGESWEIQRHWDYSHAIWMLDELNGYLGDHSGFIMVTHDGGDTWNYHGGTGSPVTDISFSPGSDTGYVTTDESYYFWQITPSGVNQIFIDHLNYWSGISATEEDVWFCGGIQVFRFNLAQQELITEFVIHCGYFGPVFFIDNEHGWIGNLCEIRGFINYYEYWPKIMDTDEDAITCLHTIDTSQLWAVTFDGKIYHTSNAWDYGYIPETNYYWSNVVWEEQTHPKEGELLNAIQVTSPHTGYACGNNNTILKYSLITDIPDKPVSEIRICPNPVSDIAEIEWTGCTVRKIEITNLSGKVVKTIGSEFNGKSNRIPLGFLPAGIYFVRICCDHQTIVRKIIKL